MSRRIAPLVALVAVVVVACGSSSPAATLTDPKEILTRSVEALQAVKTFHVKADVTGKITMDLTGQGGGGSIDLAGTTAEGDVDIAGEKLHLAANAPALFGTTADIIVADGVTYTKIGGPLSQSGKYAKDTSGGSNLGAPTDPKKALDDVRAALDKLTTPPTKAPDEKCGDKDCYRVTIKLPASDLAGVNAVPGVSGDATLDVWVHKDDLRPGMLSIAIAAGGQGTVTVTMELSNYDGSVSIQAPPADQVEG